MAAEAWRSITDKEKLIIKSLLSKEFPGRDALRQQLEMAEVSEVDAEGSLKFRVVGPQAFVERRVPTEALYFDHGGDSRPAVNLLLHVVDGKLHELEVYKDDGSPIEIGINDIDLAQLRFLS